MNKLKKVLDKLDAENMAISLGRKSKLGCKQVELLGYVINNYGTIPMQKKTEAILQLKHSKTFKQLKSLMGSIHHLIKFIHNLAQLCTPLRPLLSTANKYHFTWDDSHEMVFKSTLDAVHIITEKSCASGLRRKSKRYWVRVRIGNSRWFGYNCLCLTFSQYIRK